jgi:hypothetical protein
MTKFQAFTKKLDDFEDNHPVIADIIKVICSIGIMICVVIIASGLMY